MKNKKAEKKTKVDKNRQNKLVIVDEFLNNHLNTHTSDVFYDGDVAYWETKDKDKIWAETNGKLNLCGHLLEGLKDNPNNEFIKRKINETLEPLKKEEISADNINNFLEKVKQFQEDVKVRITNPEEARKFFDKGDDDVQQSNWMVNWDNNWTETSFERNGKRAFGDDSVVSIKDFIHMNDKAIQETVDYFTVDWDSVDN